MKPDGLPTATVERVSDGDTVVLRFPDGRRERTRLIGIDTPEVHESQKLERDVQRSGGDRATIQALGRQASAFTKRLLPEDARVEVEHDVQARDRHGRLLVYLWRGDELVNLVILREGYGHVLTVAAQRPIRVGVARLRGVRVRSCQSRAFKDPSVAQS